MKSSGQLGMIHRHRDIVPDLPAPASQSSQTPIIVWLKKIWWKSLLHMYTPINICMYVCMWMYVCKYAYTNIVICMCVCMYLSLSIVFSRSSGELQASKIQLWMDLCIYLFIYVFCLVIHLSVWISVYVCVSLLVPLVKPSNCCSIIMHS